MRATKLGFLGLDVGHNAEMESHYLDVLGLAKLGGGGRDGVHFGCLGAEPSVSMMRGDKAGLASLGYQITTPKLLAEVVRDLGSQGVQAELRSDVLPGLSQVVKLADPDGNTIFLYTERELLTVEKVAPGIRPNKLGHVALYVADAQKHAKFFTDVLGFRWSDWLEDFFVFMRCNADHHSMNFMTHQKRGLFHVAFELHDWSHIGRACDFLAKRDIPLTYGPGRHGMGHNIFTYHNDPDGNIVELFCDLDRMSDEALGYFDPRPHHEDFPQRPKVWQRGGKASNSWGIMPTDAFRKR